jgi:osmotically inducible protein OsmC
MAMADRQAHTLWEGSLMGGKGDTEFASSAIGRFPVTWAARTESPGGKTSPEELLAAAHATCYAMAFSPRPATRPSASTSPPPSRSTPRRVVASS